MSEFDEYFDGFYQTMSPSEFFAWCEEIPEKLRGNREFAKAYRVNSTNFIKKFREEAIPIYFFIKQGLVDIKTITLSDDTTNFDATIVLSDESTKHIEVTCAKDGELERWENETLNEKGGMPITHGSNAKAVREALKSGASLPFVATDDETEMNKIVPMIADAVVAKQNKKRDYPPSTYLLVSFNCFHNEEDDIAKIAERVRTSVKIDRAKFQEVFLVNCQARAALRIT